MESIKHNNMSNVTLVDYSDSSSDEKQRDNSLSRKIVQSAKEIAVVQPTFQGHMQSQVNSADVPAPPINSLVTDNGEHKENDQNDLDDVAHILLDFPAEARRGGNFQSSGNHSSFIEISSSPLYDPEEEEIVHAEIISSDSDTIPSQSPLSENSQPFDLYNEFDVIISDNSCITGENFKIFKLYI